VQDPKSWQPCATSAIGILRLTGATNIAAALRRNARNPDRPL